MRPYSSVEGFWISYCSFKFGNYIREPITSEITREEDMVRRFLKTISSLEQTDAFFLAL